MKAQSNRASSSCFQRPAESAVSSHQPPVPLQHHSSQSVPSLNLPGINAGAGFGAGITDTGIPEMVEVLEQEQPWNQSPPQDVDLEECVSGDDEITAAPMGQGIKITTREVTLKRKRHLSTTSAASEQSVADNSSFGQSDGTSGGGGSDDTTVTPSSSRASRSIRLLPEDVQDIILVSIEFLRAHLSKTDPWPDAGRPSSGRGQSVIGLDEYSKLALEFWFDACSILDVNDHDEPTRVQLKRIIDRTPQFRGQVRDKAAGLLKQAYGFVDHREANTKLTKDEIAKIMDQNRDIYEKVKNKFWYQDPLNTSIPNTMYQHHIIQQVLNKAWFGDGIFARSKFFTGDKELPLVTIALILTAISNALDGWRLGTFTKCIEFTCKEYQPQYVKYLDNLKKWKAYCVKEHRDLAAELQVSLLANARLSSGIEDATELDAGHNDASDEDLLALFAANQG